MTAVEFYNGTPIENAVSSLTTVPDKIIFIGDGKVMRRFDCVYRSFLNKRGLDIKLEYRSINKNEISNIVAVLSEIVENEQQCVFDLTGGDELVLVAMGIVFQKYADKNIQMQRLNVKTGVVTDCDKDGTVFFCGRPEISVEENIALHGGAVRYVSDDSVKTYRWDLSEEFICDIEKMWNICRNDPGLWNLQITILGSFEEIGVSNGPLSVSVDIPEEEYASIKGLLDILERKRLINSFNVIGTKISFNYKNEQVKRCLTKAGMCLELKVLVAARELYNKDNTPFYTDSMNGVCIDWDGVFHNTDDAQKDTENEIDIILMKGMVPIFISCKNGRVENEELYKLETVANRFGGKYVKKVLIATYLGGKSQDDRVEHVKQRAIEMKINMIDGVHLLDDEQFIKMVKNLSCD